MPTPQPRHEILLDILARQVGMAAAMLLGAAGYHRHDRGHWRRRRPTREATMPDQVATLTPEQAIALRAVGLMRDARLSQEAAQSWFREIGDQLRALGRSGDDGLVTILDGDPVRTVEETLLARLAPKDHLRREAIRRSLQAVRLDLGSAEAGPIERCLIDRVAACWLAVQSAEADLARAEDHPRGPLLADERRLDCAQRRFLAVLRTLDQVRRRVPGAQLRVPSPTEARSAGACLALNPPPPVDPT